jgi:superfamily II DNA helicase RecQ
MKCKVFKIHLDEETRSFEEVKFNKFLESVSVRQTFASVIGDEFWSILVFYDEDSVAAQTENLVFAEKNLPPVKPTAAKPSETEKPAPEPIILNPQEEIAFNALRDWRNEKANRDGIPPYMIAHNDSLMQIARFGVKSKEELIGIKGFGEKRAEKYGDEILEILRLLEDTPNE